MSFFATRRVLVTGATGLLGSHLAEALANRGAAVIGTTHRAPPVVHGPRIEHRAADLTRADECRAAVRGCDTAILAAANSSGARVMRENPVAHVTENLMINAQMLEACMREGVERVLFISSTVVYPPSLSAVREDEAFSGDPFDSYYGVGWMKRYSEKLAEFYRRSFGIRIAIARPTNVFGPRDKFDPDRSHVLPALIRRAVEGQDPFQVWGDGQAVRDFLYVSDAVDGLLALLERAGETGPVNLGSGRLVTVRESVDLILRKTGRSGTRVVYDPTKPTTIPHRSVDLTRARETLGFEARVPFEQGLQRTIEWFQSRAT